MTPSDAERNLQHDAEQRRREILAMSAGPELDLLIARDVLGHKIQIAKTGGITWERLSDSDSDWVMLKPYSTDCGAAWSVVEVVRAQWGVRIEDTPEAWWLVTVGRAQACAETMPHAVAIAALLAKLEAGR